MAATIHPPTLSATPGVATKAAAMPGWRSLGAPSAELRLEFTLPTGQSFRWRQTGEGEYTGVVDRRVVRVQQLEDDVVYQVIARGEGAHPADDEAVLRDYFSLDASLAALSEEWAQQDARFRNIRAYFPGARVLRQDPVECLFQFICSSNNHILRIHGMVERLARQYGTPLHTIPAAAAGSSLMSIPVPAVEAEAVRLTDSTDSQAEAAQCLGSTAADNDTEARHGAPLSNPELPTPSQPSSRKRQAAVLATSSSLSEVLPTAQQAQQQQSAAVAKVPDLAFYAFPTLEQLSKATEADLRADGFGYRAKFITGSVAALLEKPGGGSTWLKGLRTVPYAEASEALCTLMGIGPKVAACICLFALDKTEAIPVDTHVWQLAIRYYTPNLKGKSLTKKVNAAVEAAFVDLFGPFAGWAHNTLFISELASQRERLPPHLRPPGSAKASGAAKTTRKAAKPKNAAVVVQGDALAEHVEAYGAAKESGMSAKRRRSSAKVKVQPEQDAEAQLSRAKAVNKSTADPKTPPQEAVKPTRRGKATTATVD